MAGIEVALCSASKFAVSGDPPLLSLSESVVTVETLLPPLLALLALALLLLFDIVALFLLLFFVFLFVLIFESTFELLFELFVLLSDVFDSFFSLFSDNLVFTFGADDWRAIFFSAEFDCFLFSAVLLSNSFKLSDAVELELLLLLLLSLVLLVLLAVSALLVASAPAGATIATSSS